MKARTSAANSGQFVDVTYRWGEGPDGIELGVEVDPSANWDCTWPRVGVRLDLPPELRHAAWFGTGPNENYPDTQNAARVGRFTGDVEQLNIRYSRPQETGHRAALRTLAISDSSAVRLRVATVPDASGHRPGFTLSAHTPQQLDRAMHPHELPASKHSYLFIDDAVHGIGSRSCGVDVLPRYALWPSRRQFRLIFTRP